MPGPVAGGKGGAKAGSLLLGFIPLGAFGQVEALIFSSQTPEVLIYLPPEFLVDRVRLVSFVVPADIVDLLRKVPFALDGEYLNEAKSVCFVKDGRGGLVGEGALTLLPRLDLLLLMLWTWSSTRCCPDRNLLSEGSASEVSSATPMVVADRSGSGAIIFPTRRPSCERIDRTGFQRSAGPEGKEKVHRQL